jgi:integrase
VLRRKTIGRELGKLAPYVFVDSEGEHFHTRARRNRFTKSATSDMKAAGIADASFHTLRHTAAAWTIQVGRSLYEVQRILGHSTPTMTQRYAHLEPEHPRDAVDALDAAMRGVDTPVDKTGSDNPQPDAATRASANLSGASGNVGR